MDTQRPEVRTKPSVSHLGPESFVSSGARSFFEYRDLGITAATDGSHTARVVRAKPGPPVPTGWHFHTCDVQLVFCLRGWEDLAFEDGSVVRIEPGSCINIPSGYGHSEIGYSEDMEVLVFTQPAVIGTTEIPVPEGCVDYR